MSKIIKLKIFQEKAVFRTPWSMEVIESYPLPPYSTILGFIHKMLSTNQTIDGINISVQGRYGNLAREFVRYHKYEESNPEGKPYPIVVTFLTDLEIIIHIRMPTLELHNKLLFSLENPPYYPYLGRAEDLITELVVQEDEERELDPTTTKAGGLELPYNSYIQFEIAKNLDIEGIPFLIPSYYKVLARSKSRKRSNQELFRDFEMIKVIYAQAGQTVVKKIPVDSENLPIWWMK